MKVKNIELKWYTLRYDSNNDKVYTYNIFGKDYPNELAKNIRNKRITNREELKEYLTRDLKYHYWSKFEHEIAVGNLLAKDLNDLEKIDIWYQLEPNIDNIVDYIIMKMKINF